MARPGRDARPTARPIRDRLDRVAVGPRPRETSARRALAIMRRALALVSVDDDDLVGRRGRALLGAYLNSDPDNQVYVFMFAFSVLLFSVPPLLKLKNVLYPPEVEPEAWDYEQEIADLAPNRRTV